ncbi:hypothetical protein [Parabacteroides sp. CH2-D42-20]|uniref:hypothetical protein n=1 Tax=Parabacteroides sp. CH2-D42-20 TaxID=2320086 RepID=UPI00131423AF|nr:hypothetical protein [Parabacteroides sp. CH2-D42-20]
MQRRIVPVLSIVLAQSCHAGGIAVPQRWQGRATTMARACHKDGTAMPPVWHPVRHLSIQTVRFSELFGAITLYFLLK